MSVIRVGQGVFKKSFPEAIRLARPKDQIFLDEGFYDFPDGFTLSNIQIIGNGARDKVILRTGISVKGGIFLGNLSLYAPPYGNALNLSRSDSGAELDGVKLNAEPAGKYPGIYSASGSVTLRNCQVYAANPDGNCRAPIVIEKKTRLFIENSKIDGVIGQQSNVQIAHSTIAYLEISNGSMVRASGKLVLMPPENKWALDVDDESSIEIDSLGCANPIKISLSESLLSVQSVDSLAIGKIEVVASGNAKVQAPPGSVQVYDADELARKAQEPKQIIWRLDDANRFEEVIAPQLRSQDTLVLAEEGDYFLPGDGCFSLNNDVISHSNPESTILHGGIWVQSGKSIKLSGFTLENKVYGNVINVKGESAQIDLRDMIISHQIDEADEDHYPAIYCGDQAQLTITNSKVVAQANDSYSGVVYLESESKLDASNCQLGWVRICDNSSAMLKDVEVFQLNLGNGAEVTATGNLKLLENDCNQRSIILESANAKIANIEFFGSDHELYTSDSQLVIENTTVPDSLVPRLVIGEQRSKYSVGDLYEIYDRHETAVSVAGQALSAGHTEDPKPPRDQDEPASKDDSDALREINELIGLAKVKEQIRSFLRTVQFNQRRIEKGLSPRETTMHSFFIGPPGTGKTTVARLLGKALFQAGAIKSESFVEVQPNDFLNGHDTPQTTEAILEKARGGVLFVDEAYGFYKENNNEFAIEALNKILTFMENNRSDIVVIFAGYEADLQKVMLLNDGLESRFANRFSFESYSGDEIAEIGYQSLVNQDYNLEDETLYRELVAAEYSRAIDPANARWVRERFNSPLLDAMQKRVLDEGNDDVQTITTADMYAVSGGDLDIKQARVDQIMTKLDSLVGLAPVKEFVHNLLAEATYNREFEQTSTGKRPAYHMIFTGNPGTGKTTVAKLIAELFYNLDILQKATVKRVTRSDLVGQYLGQTEAQTKLVLKESLGGVLFVDEAYQLSRGLNSGAHDFGGEAVEVLMDAMAEQSDKFVAIFAGYTNEMADFLKINPGLTSRITGTIEFPDYSAEEIAQIVKLRLQPKYSFDVGEVSQIVAQTYNQIPVGNTSLRANGRWAERFVESVERLFKKYVLANQIDLSEGKIIPTDIFHTAANDYLEDHDLMKH